MNAFGSVCAIIFAAACISGALQGLRFAFYEFRSATDKHANEQRQAEYRWHVREGQAAFFWSWIVGATAFGLGSWLGGWTVDY